jgi:uncharacterized protein YciI
MMALVVVGALGLAVSAEENKPAPTISMKTYFLGLIRKGPAWTPDDTPEVRALQEGHMANIRRLGAEGTLVLAGPFLDGGDLRGLFLFEAATLEEAKALCETDPAVKAGRLIVEVHPWLGPAGLTFTGALPRPTAPPPPLPRPTAPPPPPPPPPDVRDR